MAEMPAFSPEKRPELPGEATEIRSSGLERGTSSRKHLILVDGSCKTNKLLLESGTCLIGRRSASSRCNVQLDTDDLSVSRTHAKIEFKERAGGRIDCLISDAGSKNGTSVNEQRLSAQDVIILRSGDVITMGKIKFKFISE